MNTDRYAARKAQRETDEKLSAQRRREKFQQTIDRHQAEQAAKIEREQQAQANEDSKKNLNAKGQYKLLDEEFSLYKPFRTLKTLRGAGYHPKLLKCNNFTTPLNALIFNLEEASSIYNAQLHVLKKHNEITYVIISKDSDLFIMSVYSGRSCSDRGHIFTAFPYLVFGITKGFEGAQNFISDSGYTLIYDSQTGVYDEEFTQSFASQLPGTRY